MRLYCLVCKVYRWFEYRGGLGAGYYCTECNCRDTSHDISGDY